MVDYAQDINPQEVLDALNGSDLESVRHAVFVAGELGLTETVEILCRLIQSTNIGVQEAAEYALRKIRGKQTVQKILPLLRSESPSLRNIAMDILREICGDDIASIQPFLRDIDPDIRIFIADILGHAGSIKAVPLLCEALLKDPEVNVRYQAAMSLGNLGYAEAVDALKNAMHDEEWVQFSVVEALVKIRAHNTVDMLVAHLSKCSLLVASVIIDALGEVRNIKAVPLLLGYIEKANPVLHNKAVKAIIQILGEGSLALLSKEDQVRFKGYLESALEDEDESIQQSALAGLSAVGDVASSQVVMNFILRLTIDLEDDMYISALKTLAVIGYNESFAGFLRSDDNKIVYISLEACQYLTDACAINDIIDVFWSLDRDNQRLSMQYIMNFANAEHAAFVLDVLERTDDSSVLKAAMTCLGERLQYSAAQEKIFSLLFHSYNDVKETAVEACIKLHTPELEAKFVELFASDDAEHRLMALYALCNYEAKNHLDIITKGLQDENPSVRQMAVESFACSSIDLRDYIDIILEKLNDPDRDVRIAVVDVVGNANDDTVTPYLINALDDEDEWVCVRAIEALGTLQGEIVPPLLVKLLERSSLMVTFKIIEVLAQLGGNVAFGALLKLMSNEDAEIQQAATAAIEKIQAGRK